MLASIMRSQGGGGQTKTAQSHRLLGPFGWDVWRTNNTNNLPLPNLGHWAVKCCLIDEKLSANVISRQLLRKLVRCLGARPSNDFQHRKFH